jgi:hypothetical protein
MVKKCALGKREHGEKSEHGKKSEHGEKVSMMINQYG